MDSQQQSEVHFPGNALTADAPWGATAFPARQHLQSAPSSHYHLAPGQSRVHVGVVQDAVFPPANATGNHQPGEHMPPPVAAQVQPRDMRYVDMGHYGVADDRPPLHEHRDHAINYAGVALDVPAREEAAPPVPEIDIFNGPARNPAVDPALAFFDEWPPQAVPNAPANEVLRQLAILYLREPNSQVAIIRMEPGNAHGVRVVITLELANL